MNKKKPDWKNFELAVFKLLSALDPDASITYDAMLPDADTGEPRQRDIWITTTILNHFQIKILVSCKRYKRKLDQQHIDAFIGEMLSSGANKGVIYSYSGFSENAIKKATSKGISCCKLFQNEKPDIPEQLIFDAYLRTPVMVFAAYRLNTIDSLPKTYGELFDLEIPEHPTFIRTNTIRAIDLIEKIYYQKRSEIREKSRESGNVPSEWEELISIKYQGIDSICLKIGGSWNIYKGKIDGFLIDGSYSFTDKSFVGKQSYPSISEHGPDPGSHWEKIEEIPSEITKASIEGTLYGGDVSIRKILQAAADTQIILI